ncbi:MAG: restriction endonuclease subunit S [bacterium]
MNNNFGLSEIVINKIHSVFKQHTSIKKVVIYGSRAKGNYRAGSDIDLTIFGENITLIELRNIYDELDELLLPYTFDISVYDDLKNDKLKEHINRVGKEFYFSDTSKTANWEIKKLGELFEITSSKRVYQAEWKQSGIPFYRAREIVKLSKDGYVDNELFISKEMYSNYAAKYGIPCEGDIMITAVGTLGICYVVRKNHKFYFKDGNIIWLKKKSEINSKFIEYFFQTPSLKKQIAQKTGATVNTYTIIDAKNTEILLPPIYEQKRIVVILDEAFTEIAKAKNNAERNLKNAKELFESYLNNIFENKGAGWEEKCLKLIATIINGYAFPSKEFNATNSVKSIKITNVGVKEFIEGTSDYLPEKRKDICKDVLVKEGNIVIALTRTIISTGLKVAVVPKSYDGSLVNQRVAALAPNEGIVNKSYLYYYLTTADVFKYVLDHVNTLMQPNLSINDLKNMLIPFPSINVQLYMVNRLDKMRNETKKLEEIYKKEIEDLEELKKSILEKAFKGEL